jgi:ketosteroid isomerase-like protein
MSDSLELVQSGYDAFAQGDVPKVLELLSVRVSWEVSSVLPEGGSWRGRDGVAEFFEQLGSLWADLALDVEGWIDDGQNVIAVGRAAGLLRAQGNAAAGYEFVHLFTVSEGEIARFRAWADPDEALREHMARG